MTFHRVGAFAAIASACLALSPTSASAAKPWVMGYLPGYEQALYPVAKIDFSSLSHIAVGRYVPRADGSLDKSCDWDAAKCPAWAKSVGAKAHAAGKKAILFLGGAGAHDGFAGAASSANRARFVANVVKEVKALQFDGVDVDWEPVQVADRANLVALLKDLHKARPAMTITMPINWVNPNIGSGDFVWLKKAAPYLNQINLMTYGMDGSDWGWTQTWHSSALKGATPERPSSVTGSVDAILALGIPAAKLGIGMGFYGQCWTGGVTAPRQDASEATIAGDDGKMSYAAIMGSYYKAANYHFDSQAGASYLGSAAGLGPLGCTYISYEDPKSIAAKVAYVKSKSLGGAIIWTISQGYQAKQNANPPLTAAGKLLK
ncbi:glycoside hydrolase family 18 protein [Oryzibacter oryziterrae]|uniref:glycoside hydrolase family 18 protein n=1 Tax=Oryzibacter oryziterrae TaxID=2766474 RepID=UPI001F4168AD|nr:glycoside hydrolase family 18 protein [Oryzibacter oryziterrae]